MMIEFARWYAARSPAIKVSVSAIYWFGLLYFGAVVEKQVQAYTTEAGLPAENQRLYFMTLFLVVAAAALIHYWIREALGAARRQDEERAETLAYAASLMDQRVSERTQRFGIESARGIREGKKDALVQAFGGTLEDIRQTVVAAYSVFEARYGEAYKKAERIDFEVTFMTRSYVDTGITVAAYANRAGRAPLSLLKRAGTPDLYADTVTAECYRDGRAHLRVTEDTMNDRNYKEVYPGQKERIRSSIVCPVLSHDNKILGTLVVHCNQIKFFRNHDAKFWQEVAETFTKRIAFDKVRMDVLYADLDAQQLLGISVHAPF